MEKFELFRKLTEESSEEEIRKGIRSLGKFKLCKLTIPANVGAYIFRTRLSRNEFTPKSETEISINPNFEKISKGRANPQGYPVFYGCSARSTDKLIQDKVIYTALAEGSSIFREKDIENKSEQGCVSRWEIMQELKIAAFINFDFKGKLNEDIKLLKDEFKKSLFVESKKGEEDWYINNLISEKFATKYSNEDKEKYNIVSVFARHVLETEGYDGIIFPSVLTDGSVFNFALNFEASKKLQLKHCSIVVNFTKEGRFHTVFLKETNDIKNGMIKNYKNCNF